MNILADATLPSLQDWFGLPFHLNLYHSIHDLQKQLPQNDILICRSTLRVNKELLEGSHIQAVATASSGIDHIDRDYLKKNSIELFDAKGCNARSVADYVLATLAYLFQHKSLQGQSVGIIGMGEVGSRVKKRLDTAGCEVFCYDPIREGLDNVYDYCSVSDISRCDIICVHANLHNTHPFPSVNLLSEDFFKQLKPHVILINASRGGIINENALLACQPPLIYCTDVYQSEPSINPQIVNYATLCTPHVAGHSIEAKQNAIKIISEKIHKHYKLAWPIPPQPSDLQDQITTQVPWQDHILKLYNPEKETLRLKQSMDKTQAFLSLRKAHNNRHDFMCYNPTYSLFID